METIRRTHLKSLAHRGTIQGVTISTLPSPTSQAKDLCHYFGGVRYGLAPLSAGAELSPYPNPSPTAAKKYRVVVMGVRGFVPNPAF